MKNKKSLIASLALAGVILVGGTIAYFSQSNSIDNVLGTKAYGSEIVEKFTPTDEWVPGATTEKKVSVTNTGDYPIIARVKWSEKWKKNGEVVSSGSYRDTDSATSNYVHKNYTQGSKWIEGGDDYAYYTEVIGTKSSSGSFLDSITLDKSVSIGMEATTVTYYTTEAVNSVGEVKEWTQLSEGEKLPETITFVRKATTTDGKYAGAQYTLTITVEVLQATHEAIDATWKTATNQTVIDFLANIQ